MSNSKPITFNIKKSRKMEAKKRKLEAFLNLVRQDELNCANQNKKPKTFSEEYKALKDELNKYQKKKEVDPTFYLVDNGKKAMVKFSKESEKPSCVSPLFIEDIYHLLLKSILGSCSKYPLQWAKLERANGIAKTVFIEIKGLSYQNILEMNAAFNEMFLLPYIVDVISSGTSFATEISTLHLENDTHLKNYSSMIPMNNVLSVKPNIINEKNSVSKLHLLLSPIQLAMEHYPLPQSIFEQSRSDDYSFSKDSYTPVHSDSPMFAVDCEMCRTVTGKQEVTRIAIVNESLETVYHTLVKPKEEIVDYITRFSGITEKMLRNVETTLSDVHRDIQNILPTDAILCGQSLNCDLHALKMIHPYVIDTSVIYNENGIRHKKTSLKHLARIHLKETIQDGKKGHNPIEDSIATMKLVQLKLKKSVKYGDAALSADTDDSNSLKIENNTEIVSQSDVIVRNLTPKDSGFFSLVSRFSKKICLIGDENSFSNYPQEIITGNVTQVHKSSVKEITKATLDNIEKNDFIMSHLTIDAEKISVSELKNEIKELYDGCPKNTLFIIVKPDINSLSNQYFTHNFCTISLKN